MLNGKNYSHSTTLSSSLIMLYKLFSCSPSKQCGTGAVVELGFELRGAKFLYDIRTYTNLCEYIIFETNLKN